MDVSTVEGGFLVRTFFRAFTYWSVFFAALASSAFNFPFGQVASGYFNASISAGSSLYALARPLIDAVLIFFWIASVVAWVSVRIFLGFYQWLFNLIGIDLAKTVQAGVVALGYIVIAIWTIGTVLLVFTTVRYQNETQQAIDRIWCQLIPPQNVIYASYNDIRDYYQTFVAEIANVILKIAFNFIVEVIVRVGDFAAAVLVIVFKAFTRSSAFTSCLTGTFKADLCQDDGCVFREMACLFLDVFYGIRNEFIIPAFTSVLGVVRTAFIITLFDGYLATYSLFFQAIVLLPNPSLDAGCTSTTSGFITMGATTALARMGEYQRCIYPRILACVRFWFAVLLQGVTLVINLFYELCAMLFGGTFCDLFRQFFAQFTSIVNFLLNTFTILTSFVLDIINPIIAPLEAAIAVIEDIINDIIGTINSIINAINSISFAHGQRVWLRGMPLPSRRLPVRLPASRHAARVRAFGAAAGRSTAPRSAAHHAYAAKVASGGVSYSSSVDGPDADADDQAIAEVAALYGVDYDDAVRIVPFLEIANGSMVHGCGFSDTCRVLLEAAGGLPPVVRAALATRGSLTASQMGSSSEWVCTTQYVRARAMCAAHSDATPGDVRGADWQLSVGATRLPDGHECKDTLEGAPLLHMPSSWPAFRDARTKRGLLATIIEYDVWWLTDYAPCARAYRDALAEDDIDPARDGVVRDSTAVLVSRLGMRMAAHAAVMGTQMSTAFNTGCELLANTRAVRAAHESVHVARSTVAGILSAPPDAAAERREWERVAAALIEGTLRMPSPLSAAGRAPFDAFAFSRTLARVRPMFDVARVRFAHVHAEVTGAAPRRTRTATWRGAAAAVLDWFTPVPRAARSNTTRVEPYASPIATTRTNKALVSSDASWPGASSGSGARVQGGMRRLMLTLAVRDFNSNDWLIDIVDFLIGAAKALLRLAVAFYDQLGFPNVSGYIDDIIFVLEEVPFTDWLQNVVDYWGTELVQMFRDYFACNRAPFYDALDRPLGQWKGSCLLFWQLPPTLPELPTDIENTIVPWGSACLGTLGQCRFSRALDGSIFGDLGIFTNPYARVTQVPCPAGYQLCSAIGHVDHFDSMIFAIEYADDLAGAGVMDFLRSERFSQIALGLLKITALLFYVILLPFGRQDAVQFVFDADNLENLRYVGPVLYRFYNNGAFDASAGQRFCLAWNGPLMTLAFVVTTYLVLVLVYAVPAYIAIASWAFSSAWPLLFLLFPGFLAETDVDAATLGMRSVMYGQLTSGRELPLAAGTGARDLFAHAKTV